VDLPLDDMEVDTTATEGANESMMVEVTWMQTYLAYLLNKELPQNQVKERRIARRSKAFSVVKDELYKRSITGVLQRCDTPMEGKLSSRTYTKGFVVIMQVIEHGSIG
jgi:hypothetical protein